MANIAGYRAITEATYQFCRFFCGQITSAGKVPRAKVLVVGAGVAGLAAIGSAKTLGADVWAFDTRPEVKEQILSMGARFLEFDRVEESQSQDGYAKEMSQGFIDSEVSLLSSKARDVDIIITTALIPGKPAPKLITEEMISSMKQGSVIVDLAAAAGGNCALTMADKVVTTSNGVKIVGYTDLPNRLPAQSSRLYSQNLLNMMKLLSGYDEDTGQTKNYGSIDVDLEEVVIRTMTVISDGKIIWPAPPIPVSYTEKTEKIVPIPKVDEVKDEAKDEAKDEEEQKITKEKIFSAIRKYGFVYLNALLFIYFSNIAPASFLSHFTVFALSCVVGYYLVWKVTPALHTPLMSVTNAISGIIIIGAILQISGDGLVGILSFLAVLIASINIFGGFTVTQRMLKLFRKK
jgi:NAD(P) transhydrogenase subunit alpha